MNISNHFPRFTLTLLFFFCTCYPGEKILAKDNVPGLNDKPPDSLRLNEIFAPVFVGRPTDNAFNGLVQLPDAELRHYGFEGFWNSPSVHAYIYSQEETCPQVLPIHLPSVNGINYVHFQSVTDIEDKEGYLVESVMGVVK